MNRIYTGIYNPFYGKHHNNPDWEQICLSKIKNGTG